MFDKNKPYGIIGGVFGIARFEQGGKYYDAQLNLLDDKGEPLKSNKQTKSAPPSGNGQTNAGETTSQAPAENTTANQAPAPAPQAPADDKDALLARAKALNIKSPHLFGLEKLQEKIAQAEAALDPNAQLAAQLGE